MKAFRIIALALGLVLPILLLSGCSGSNSRQSGQLKSFALCITDKNATLFGLPSCPTCKKQREMFKNAFKYVDYVDCSSSQNLCNKKNVSSVPVWIIDGEKYDELLSLNKLSKITGCQLGERAG